MKIKPPAEWAGRKSLGSGIYYLERTKSYWARFLNNEGHRTWKRLEATTEAEAVAARLKLVNQRVKQSLANPENPTGIPFIGLYFKFYDIQSSLVKKGKVVSSPQPGWYLIRTSPNPVIDFSFHVLAAIEVMKDWVFFRTKEDREAFPDHLLNENA